MGERNGRRGCFCSHLLSIFFASPSPSEEEIANPLTQTGKNITNTYTHTHTNILTVKKFEATVVSRKHSALREGVERLLLQP